MRQGRAGQDDGDAEDGDAGQAAGSLPLAATSAFSRASS